jgi:hypothetical protein
MRRISIAFIALFVICPVAFGEAPSLSVYEIIPRDRDHGPDSGELLLKLNKPTDKPFYIFGLFLADIPYTPTHCPLEQAAETFPSVLRTACSASGVKILRPACKMCLDHRRSGSSGKWHGFLKHPPQAPAAAQSRAIVL